MRKCFVWVVVICLSITLTACNRDRNVLCSNQLYDIYLEAGRCYLKFNKEIVEDEKIGYSAISSPKFSSVEEMKRKILAGELSKANLEGAYLNARWTDGITEIYDLTHLYEAYIPDDTQIKQVVWGGGCHYYFQLESAAFLGTCNMSVYTEEGYNQKFSEAYTNFPNELQTVHSTINIADRNAVETRYGNHTGEYKVIKYTLSDEARTLYIRETYCLEHIYDEDWPSETVPTSIYLFGIENGAWFRASFHDLTERPSVEWLSSFGLTPLDSST